MNTIYINADEQHVASVVLYPKTDTDNAHLCVDPEKEVEISSNELFNLVTKQLAIIRGDSDQYYIPIAFKKYETYTSVDVTTKSGVAKTFHSKEQG